MVSNRTIVFGQTLDTKISPDVYDLRALVSKKFFLKIDLCVCMRVILPYLEQNKSNFMIMMRSGCRCSILADIGKPESLTWETKNSYLKNNSNDFIPIHYINFLLEVLPYV